MRAHSASSNAPIPYPLWALITSASPRPEARAASARASAMRLRARSSFWRSTSWYCSAARAPTSIASRRGKHVAHHYQAIGGRSPLLEFTRRQAEALEAELGNGCEARVTIAMRYWKPFSA